jgi:hypothetical protein
MKSAEMDYGRLTPISVEGKWGYINVRGEVVIQPQFIFAWGFSEGLGRVEFAGTSDVGDLDRRTHTAFIDEAGSFVIPAASRESIINRPAGLQCSYDAEFHEGLACFHPRDRHHNPAWGFIDKTGRVMIPASFGRTTDFSEGMAFVATWRDIDDPRPHLGGGFIDRTGAFVIESKSFLSGGPFQEGRAPVTVRRVDAGDVEILIDRTGKRILGPFDRVSSVFGGACVVRRKPQYAIYNLDGQEVVPFGRYDRIKAPRHGEVFTATRNGIWYILTAAGDELVAMRLGEELENAYDDTIVFRCNGKCGVVDDQGQVIVEPVYEYIGDFERGLAHVKMNRRWGSDPVEKAGYVNRAGVMVWQTDRWDKPVRNQLQDPIQSILPESIIEARPSSRNWDARNAVVFVAREDVESLRQWYLNLRAKDLEVDDETDYTDDPGAIHLTVRDNVQFEIVAINGDAANTDAFVSHYVCRNLDWLRRTYPKATIGVILEYY